MDDVASTDTNVFIQAKGICHGGGPGLPRVTSLSAPSPICGSPGLSVGKEHPGGPLRSPPGSTLEALGASTWLL